MKRVAVLGGGPAGAFAAAQLAAAGFETTVFDEKLAWEKPCGGGVTHRAWQRYPFLFENAAPKQIVRSARFAAPRAGAIDFELSHPLVIYSRRDLNGLLLDRARQAGAHIVKTRVLAATRAGGEWHLQTQAGPAAADFCIVATGARNPLRNLGTEFRSGDTMMALGYYVPKAHPRVDLEFLSGLEGYVWVFPRHDHLSVGIGGKAESSQALRRRLEQYMRRHGLDSAGATFYAHIIPSLTPDHWTSNRVAGDGWLAAGDAGAMVDPITGEGIYFALRSAEIASQLLIDRHGALDTLPSAYRRALDADFTADLAYAASLGTRLGTYISAAAAIAIRWMRRSAAFSGIMQELISGEQPYLELKSRLMRDLAPSGLGAMMRTASFVLRPRRSG